MIAVVFRLFRRVIASVVMRGNLFPTWIVRFRQTVVDAWNTALDKKGERERYAEKGMKGQSCH